MTRRHVVDFARHDSVPRLSRRAWLSVGVGALVVAACGRSPRANTDPRCSFCGMRVPRGSHWAAGARDAAGHDLHFDTPACVFRYRWSSRGSGLRDAWLTEYYGPAGPRTPGTQLRFVAGSDVVGPMGVDLIPVDPARLDAFVRDHRGRRTFAYDDVTADVLAHLE